MKSSDHETANFSTDVLERSKHIPVLVDFWAPWCAPCKILGPVLEKLAQQQPDQWVLVKVNTDIYQDLAMQYGIRGIPAVKLFVDGQVHSEFTGALPEPVVAQWLQKNLPSQYRRLLKEAKDLLVAGCEHDAQKILEQIVVKEGANEEARALLAKTYLFIDPLKALDLVKDIDAGSKYSDIGDSIRTFAEMLQKFDHPDSLPESAVKELYLKALKSLKSKDFDTAVGDFIETIRHDRYYDDDGSRKACIAIFRYLGEENEVTVKHRRDFGSALYV